MFILVYVLLSFLLMSKCPALHDRVISAQRLKPRQSAQRRDLLERQGVDLPPRARVGQLLQWGERGDAIRVWRSNRIFAILLHTTLQEQCPGPRKAQKQN